MKAVVGGVGGWGEEGGRTAIGCQRMSQCYQRPMICILTHQLIRVSCVNVIPHILTIRQLLSILFLCSAEGWRFKHMHSSCSLLNLPMFLHEPTSYTVLLLIYRCLMPTQELCNCHRWQRKALLNQSSGSRQQSLSRSAV